MAEPGEFTKRAFSNGRVDLTQAEAVMDIIRAKTDKAMNIAVKQLDGSLLILSIIPAKKSSIHLPKLKSISTILSMTMLRKLLLPLSVKRQWS